MKSETLEDMVLMALGASPVLILIVYMLLT